MIFKILVAIVPILSIANGQIFSLGHCNQNMETVVDFDKTKFIGDWYVVKRTYNNFEEGTKCYRSILSLDDSAIFSGINTVVSKCNGTKITVNYKYNAEDLNRGKINFSPGFMMDVQPFWVLATDYDFAAMYSCSDSFEGKLETAWIITKTKTPSDEVVDKGMQVFKDRGIKLKLKVELQDCE